MQIRVLEQELEDPQQPWEKAWLTIYIDLPREINQTTYFQHKENVTVTCNIPPSGTIMLTDDYGNDYMAIYWNEQRRDNITVIVETFMSREVGMTPVNTSDPYPIPEDLLSGINSVYLQPGEQTQSDDPTIVALAQNLSQGFDKQVDVVNNTLEWISENIKWRCYSEAIKEHGKYSDAVSTLKYGEGICTHFARLMTALFRAQGIPARLVHGVKGYEKSNPGYLKPVSGRDYHLWTEVYFPEVGWIRYDAPYFSHPPYITYGIPLEVIFPHTTSTHPHWYRQYPWYLEDTGGIKFTTVDDEDTGWKIVGLENNKVIFSYTRKMAPIKQPEG